MFGIGVQELLIILVLVLIFFGAEKIPKLAKSLGRGIFEFRRAQQEVKKELLDEQESSFTAAPTPLDAPTVPMYVTCPACNGRTAADAFFCSLCGQKMPLQPVCAVCQRRLMPEEKFCSNCGQAR